MKWYTHWALSIMTQVLSSYSGLGGGAGGGPFFGAIKPNDELLMVNDEPIFDPAKASKACKDAGPTLTLVVRAAHLRFARASRECSCHACLLFFALQVQTPAEMIQVMGLGKKK